MSFMISPGELRRKIKFKKFVGEDDWTTNTESPLVCETWAKIHPVAGKQFWEAQSVGATVTHEVYIRYRNDINANMIIEYKGRIFEIVYIFDIDEAERFMRILAKERL